MLVHYLSAPTLLASGGYGPGSGRFGAVIAALVALLSIALASAARRSTLTALLAQAVGVLGLSLAVWHWARSADGFGTGNGRAGAMVAVALALTGLALAARTLARPTAPKAEKLDVRTEFDPRNPTTAS